jgi:hypothetical protein
MPAPWTQAQADAAVRKTLEPSLLHAAQDNNASFTTDTLLAGVPTIVAIPNLDVKDSTDFNLVVDEFVFDRPGALNVHFLSAYGTSITCGTINTVVTTELLVNGAPVKGSSIERKISTSADVGSMSQSTYFRMDHGQTLGFRVTASNDSTVTFSRTSANVTEVN